jgi:dihydroorotase
MTQLKPILICNARLIQPETMRVFYGSLLIQDKIISDIFEGDFQLSTQDMFVIDAENNYVAPGFIDISVGVSAIGGVHKESLASLSNAALYGGVTSVVIEPNTFPVIDTPADCDYVYNRAKNESDIHVYLCGSLSHNHEAKEMTDVGLLKKAGVKALTHTDMAIDNNLLLYRSMLYASSHDMLIKLHPEDASLADGGNAHESFVSTLYGLSPHAPEAELLGLERDLILCQKTKAKLHVNQISSAKSLDIIKRYKKIGVDVTVSCSLQHLSLNEHDVIPYRTFFKMKPPLRTEQDRVALIEAVLDGTIDMITSAHRPRLADVKRLPFGEADFGCSTIENMLSLVMNIVHNNPHHNIAEIFKTVTLNPALRFNLPAGRLSKNYPADIIIFNPDEPCRTMRETMQSASTNTPYEGRLMQGTVKHVFVEGKKIL